MDGDTLRRSRSAVRVRSGRRRDHEILPSRAAVLDLLRAGLRSGPALLTGEAGSGKSWLADRLIQEADDLTWASVDLSPEATPADLYADLGLALGLDPCATHRRSLSEFLALRAADGRRFGLLVDEAHLAATATLEELRVLSNRLGRLDGFAAMVLVGQTELARRVMTYALSALESRLTARAQLRPIDADEACFLLRYEFPGRLLDGLTIERLHRDSAGNPAKLLRLASAVPTVSADRLDPPVRRPGTRPGPLVGVLGSGLDEEAEPESDPDFDPDSESDFDSDLEPERGELPLLDEALGDRLAAVRPPLRVEDHVVEVGWEDSARTTDEITPEPVEFPHAPAGVPALASTSDDEADVLPATIERDPVAVEDHYAALQAWQEWTRNQGRRLEAEPDPSAPPPEAPAVEPWSAALGLVEDDEEVADALDEDDAPSALDAMPNVWADPNQEFAPFGPLFGRARQANDRGS